MERRTHEIVLFHSALGLRPAVRRFADALRADGHLVHLPDLFDGEVFDRLEDGVRKRDALGVPALVDRAQRSVADLPRALVYAGFSMGTAPAELLAATRPGARGVVLMHGALSPADLGVERWPEVPVQVHVGARDPWVDASAVDALVASAQASGQRCELHRYEVDGHLFADDACAEWNAHAANAMLERVRRFLQAV